MRAKLSVLRACRRLLRPGGRLGFYTIYIPPGLTDDAYRQAVQAGPDAVASRRDHLPLLRSAGFADISETDVTAEFLRVARTYLEARRRHADELRRSEGEAEFDRMQGERRDRIAAIEAGLIRRSLFIARRPP